jgi:hypothetical protein
MSDPQSIEAVTVCRLCKHVIALTGLSVPIVGERPEDRATRYVAALRDHINRRHPQQAAYIEGMKKWTGEFIVIECYGTEDAVLQKGREYARAILHEMTRKNRLSDSDLKEGLARFGKTTEEIDALMPVAKYLRDFLSEQGEFQHPAVKHAEAQRAALQPD